MFAVKSSFNMVWIVLLFITSFSTRKIRIVCYLYLRNDNEDDKDDDDDDDVYMITTTNDHCRYLFLLDYTQLHA